jgi:GR25 family glycosyltransferase involved in LPS biosynthesis
METHQKLYLPFEEIYCINLVEREDKYNYQVKQFSQLGILDDVIFQRDVKYPFVKEISLFLRSNKLGYCVNNAFNCTRNHYRIIKSAYLRNVQTIMIIEDDNNFYNDIETLQCYFDNLPNDWDVLRINCLRGSHEQSHFLHPDNINKFWDKQMIGIYGTGCYALNRKAMKTIIDWIDTKFDAIDEPLFYYTKVNLNIYIPNLPLGLCFPDQFDSDINFGNGKGSPQEYVFHIKNLDKSKYLF